MSSQNVVSEARATQESAPARRGAWGRAKGALSFVDRELSFVKGLSAFTVLSSIVVGYFQYVSAYQAKVNAEATKEISDAESTYGDVATTFAKAITLQQYLFFNYRDAINAKTDADTNSMQVKGAHAIYQPYDDLRVTLRQNIDLLARKVELNLDGRSDKNRDAATTRIGQDPMTRLALGNYDFECEQDKYMPSLDPAASTVDVPPTKDILKINPNAKPLRIDWRSTKHQVLVLYYCFEVLHRRIAAPLAWASSSTVGPGVRDDFLNKLPVTVDSLNREAIRLNDFITLAAHQIELIQVRFRPRGWYCHIPVLREIVDGLTGKCSPIHTAQIGSAA